VHFAQRGGDDFDLRMQTNYVVDHGEEGSGVEFRLGRNFGPRNSESFLQILFISDQHVDIFDNALDY
jgi:hypothetical protein